MMIGTLASKPLRDLVEELDTDRPWPYRRTSKISGSEPCGSSMSRPGESRSNTRFGYAAASIR